MRCFNFSSEQLNYWSDLNVTCCFVGETTLNWIPIACLLLYVVTSMIGMLTIPWTMTAELFPTEIRGIAHSIAYSLANLIMFISVQSYRDLDYLLGGSTGVQWFFAAVSIGGK